MKKSTLLLGAAALVALLTVAVVVTSRKDPSPKAVTRPTLDSIINVHGSPEQGLRICGKTFRRVKGGPPYYITIPTTPLVLFAYESFPGTKALIVCNTNDCTFREISPDNVRFGERIGYWNATGGKMGDTVESVESNRVVLISKSFSYVERSVLDLKDDTIRVLELQSERNQIILDLWTNQQQQAPSPK